MNYKTFITLTHQGSNWWEASITVNIPPGGLVRSPNSDYAAGDYGSSQTWVGSGSTPNRALSDLMLRSSEFIPKYVL